MTEVYVSPYALLPQTDSSGFPSRSEWGWKLPSCAYNNTQHPTSASVRERGGKRVRGGRCPTEGQKLGRCKQTDWSKLLSFNLSLEHARRDTT